MDKNLIIELYKKQFKIIYLYLIKCGCSSSDAEDIVHDSFIKAIEYMECVEIQNLSSWLFKICINNYKNKVKRGKIIELVSVNEEKFKDQLVEECNIEQKIIDREVYQKIIAVLNKLKEEEKSLLIMKYDMDLSYREIALLIGSNENTIKTYLFRARNKFKREWGKLDE
ncbi:RNA polymerase sigma factor [Clostridium saccharoperbutylacetonicum]|uniref:RNA polymerase sigma factor n=1 Tax=Clostridium saccharoperbutylacetonicum TaxID=36745 RepID=UPI0039E7E1F4